jgi:molybdenum-dependent DNA-binding transcriptional regulator ModE
MRASKRTLRIMRTIANTGSIKRGADSTNAAAPGTLTASVD